MKAHDMRVKLRTEAVKFFTESSTWLPKDPERASIYHLLVTWTECLPKTSEVMKRGLGTLTQIYALLDPQRIHNAIAGRPISEEIQT